MNRDLDSSNDAKAFTFRGESNHKVNSIMRTRKEDVGLGSAEEDPHIYKRVSAVFNEEDSSSEFEDDDLDWIKMLKRLNIGDEKVKEIEDEWIKLINQLRKLSGVL